MEEKKTVAIEPAEDIALLKKESTMQRCAEVLVLNKQSSQMLQNEGNELINVITVKGMSEDYLMKMKDFLKRCKLAREEMNCRRKEFTRLMDGAKSNFIMLENAINPQISSSVASIINGYKEGFEMNLLKMIREQEQLLMKRSEMVKRRILRSRKMNEEEKNVAMKEMENDLINKQLMMNKLSISTKFKPEVINKEGYLEIINYWWNQTGMALSHEELQKALSTMLTYVAKEAKNGRFINSENIRYNEVPFTK